MRSETVPLVRGRHAKAVNADGRPAGRFLVNGEASGDIVFSSVPISFMMGVHSETGVVVDEHHPLLGTPLRNKIVVLPRGRGSCSASGVIMELLHRGNAPAALVFRTLEEILTLGVLIADAVFQRSIPVVLVEDDQVWERLSRGGKASISKHGLTVEGLLFPLDVPYTRGVETLPADEAMMRGEGCSRAAQLAMELIVEFASIQGAEKLIDISQVHIDACCYVGKTSLLVPQRLLELGAQFRVPSTCNSLNVDRQQWQALGTDPELSTISHKIGDAYLAMGAAMSFTCAPYLLDSKPAAGEQIGWGESNAVVFANSVLGARTQKYPDYLDVMIGLTGRAPAMGCHLPGGRRPEMRIDVDRLETFDDSVFPLLGYHIGAIVGGRIPMIYGLEHTSPGTAELKAFGAGFATTSSAPMFHIMGVTPEAASTAYISDSMEGVSVGVDDLRITWDQLNTAGDDQVELVALGNPHFTSDEFCHLVELLGSRSKKANVDIVITTSRFVLQKAREAGYLDRVSEFGAKIITDTCWCMLEEPVVPARARNVMTNSAKYAHYGPGITGRRFRLGSLAACLDAVCTGVLSPEHKHPRWLFG